MTYFERIYGRPDPTSDVYHEEVAHARWLISSDPKAVAERTRRSDYRKFVHNRDAMSQNH